MSRSSETSQDPVDRWTELGREVLQTQIRLGRDYVELVRTSLSSDTDRGAAGRTYLESARREGTRYWRGVSRLGLSYAADVVALGSRAGNAVTRDVRESLRKDGQEDATTRAAATASPPPAPVAGEIRLAGPLGAKLSGRVTVANRHPRARRISLRPGPLLAADGSEVAVTIEASPAMVTVPAGDESDVTLHLHLDPDACTAGADYSALIEVSGGEEATLTLLVHVND